MKNILLPYFILLSLLGSLTAQQQPLAVDPGQDQFEFCKQLYRQANSMRVQGEKILAYQRLVPRLNSYINRFPRHANTVAAQYYLGECYYHSGSIDDAKRVLMGVINRYKTGRYVALSSNRLAYD
ncbi:MAG: tetratricopeptide repeat protein, partial [Akkermansiaceae bacterium]